MSIISNYLKILEKIESLALEIKRKKSDIYLVVVTKTHNVEKIIPVLDAGHKVFGENKVQEALEKWLDLKQKYKETELHLIGPLQTNKVKDAVKLFDVIETVDREKLALRIANEMQKTNKFPECYIQINTGEESQKAGVLPQEADEFIKLCITEYKLPITGLMCIPPFDEEPSPHFALLKQIAKRNGLSKLSMGMSSDFDIAITLDATHVRVGSAIFGNRG